MTKTMRKLKIAVSVALAVALASSVVALAGCNGCSSGGDDEEHVHTFDTSAWTGDETGHWHPATCGHTEEKSGLVAHRYNDSYYCSVCGYQHEHYYSEAWETSAEQHWHKDACNHGTTSSVGDHEWDDSYTCKTCGYSMKNAGIVMHKDVVEYSLGSKKTVDIPVSDVSVKLARVNETEVSDITNYTLEYYKGAEKLESLDGVGPGAYNIWATATVEIDGESKECKSFVVVYVLDVLKDLTLNAGAVTTQSKSVINRMSDTWTFTAVYKSGITEEVSIKQCTVTGLNSNAVTAGTAATVVYTATDAKGEKSSATKVVLYTVTEAQNNVETYTYSYDALKATIPTSNQGDSTYNLSAGKLGGNEFAEILSNGVAFYRGPSNNVLEIQGDALKVSITGVGTITLSVDSTSGSNTSAIALKDKDGNYVACASNNSVISKDDELDCYSIAGKGGTIQFVILTSGEYTICTVDSVTVDGEIIPTNRHTRIQSLEVVDEQSEEA